MFDAWSERERFELQKDRSILQEKPNSDKMIFTAPLAPHPACPVAVRTTRAPSPSPCARRGRARCPHRAAAPWRGARLGIPRPTAITPAHSARAFRPRITRATRWSAAGPPGSRPTAHSTRTFSRSGAPHCPWGLPTHPGPRTTRLSRRYRAAEMRISLAPSDDGRLAIFPLVSLRHEELRRWPCPPPFFRLAPPNGFSAGTAGKCPFPPIQTYRESN